MQQCNIGDYLYLLLRKMRQIKRLSDGSGMFAIAKVSVHKETVLHHQNFQAVLSVLNHRLSAQFSFTCILIKRLLKDHKIHIIINQNSKLSNMHLCT